MNWPYAGYEHPTQKTSSVDIARRCFLATINAEVPEVLKDLYDEVLPLCLLAKLGPHLLDYKNWGGRDWERQEIWINISQGASWIKGSEIAFGRALFDWAQRWNLNEILIGRKPRWILGCAVNTLKFWKHGGLESKDLDWSYVGRLWPGLVVRNTENKFPLWNANLESRRSYLNYVAVTAKRSLEAHPDLSQGDPSHRAAYVETIVKRASDLSKKVDKHTSP